MNWHAPTEAEINGEGNWRFLIDISPDWIPHQATQDGDALLRISRPGWSWIVKEFREEGRKKELKFKPPYHMGQADTKEAAVGEALAKLAELRAGE